MIIINVTRIIYVMLLSLRWIQIFIIIIMQQAPSVIAGLPWRIRHQRVSAPGRHSFRLQSLQPLPDYDWRDSRWFLWRACTCPEAKIEQAREASAKSCRSDPALPASCNTTVARRRSGWSAEFAVTNDVSVVIILVDLALALITVNSNKLLTDWRTYWTFCSIGAVPRTTAGTRS